MGGKVTTADKLQLLQVICDLLLHIEKAFKMPGASAFNPNRGPESEQDLANNFTNNSLQGSELG